MSMLSIYIVASFLLNLFFSIIWTGKSLSNVLIKMIMILMTIFSLVVLFNQSDIISLIILINTFERLLPVQTIEKNKFNKKDATI
jgi:hypothetical protein